MVKSPIKIIDSGTAPTTANLGEGQIAFGTVDGATKLYGSDGTTVSELGGGGGTEVNSIAPAKVSVGAESFDGGSYDSLAIGNNARADLDEVQYHAGSSLAVGNNSIASDQGSTAIGVSSNAISGMAIGYNSRARNNGTALGRTAKAEGLNSVAIGSNSEATLENELSIGSDSLQRRITHVSDPTDDQDAATKKYVDTKVSEIPAGPQGDPGEPGPQGDPGTPGAAATITVGTTTTGEAGTEAAVTNSGTTSAAVLNFTIPKGAKGDKGDKGDTGDTGPAGTTTFAGLTDQPTDNAALKTALDAKADQTTVDSLTATVNGKVSSVTAGKGISITGTATAPVVNGMIAVPDYKNAQSISVPEEGWVAPDNGVIFRVFANNSVVSASLLRLSIAAAGGPQDFTYVAEVDKSAGVSTSMPVVVPVAKGDTIFFSATGAVSAYFAPYKFVEIS